MGDDGVGDVDLGDFGEREDAEHLFEGEYEEGDDAYEGDDDGPQQTAREAAEQELERDGD